MGCFGNSGIFDLPQMNKKEIKAVDVLPFMTDIDTITRRVVKLLDKQVIVNAWSYSGDGSFDEEGKYQEKKFKGCYNYKIEYTNLVDFKEHLMLIRE
jgi:hypothetical protein